MGPPEDNSARASRHRPAPRLLGPLAPTPASRKLAQQGTPPSRTPNRRASTPSSPSPSSPLLPSSSTTNNGASNNRCTTSSASKRTPTRTHVSTPTSSSSSSHTRTPAAHTVVSSHTTHTVVSSHTTHTGVSSHTTHTGVSPSPLAVLSSGSGGRSYSSGRSRRTSLLMDSVAPVRALPVAVAAGGDDIDSGGADGDDGGYSRGDGAEACTAQQQQQHLLKETEDIVDDEMGRSSGGDGGGGDGSDTSGDGDATGEGDSARRGASGVVVGMGDDMVARTLTLLRTPTPTQSRRMTLVAASGSALGRTHTPIKPPASSRRTPTRTPARTPTHRLSSSTRAQTPVRAEAGPPVDATPTTPPLPPPPPSVEVPSSMSSPASRGSSAASVSVPAVVRSAVHTGGEGSREDQGHGRDHLSAQRQADDDDGSVVVMRALAYNDHNSDPHRYNDDDEGSMVLIQVLPTHIAGGVSPSFSSSAEAMVGVSRISSPLSTSPVSTTAGDAARSLVNYGAPAPLPLADNAGAARQLAENPACLSEPWSSSASARRSSSSSPTPSSSPTSRHVTSSSSSAAAAVAADAAASITVPTSSGTANARTPAPKQACSSLQASVNVRRASLPSARVAPLTALHAASMGSVSDASDRRQRRVSAPGQSNSAQREMQTVLPLATLSTTASSPVSGATPTSIPSAPLPVGWEGQSNVMVAVRVRPVLRHDAIRTPVVDVIDRKVVMIRNVCREELERSDVLRYNRSTAKTYTFDHVFDTDDGQQVVYESTTKHLIQGVLDGFNATVFAYGNTGAGKTHTMIGSDTEAGIMVLTLQDLFKASAHKCAAEGLTQRVTVSFLEVYNETLRDLLCASACDATTTTAAMRSHGGIHNRDVQHEEGPEIREDPIRGTFVDNLTELEVRSAEEVMFLLKKGNKYRTQHPTAANEVSSRSHAVLQVVVETRDAGSEEDVDSYRIGKLTLVDLAGSERAAVTKNTGVRLQEGANINKSLLALGNCITALAGEKGVAGTFVPYRDSKLTRLLRDSLGGNCRTVMIANISAAVSSFEETLNTLKYANRAKNIKTTVRCNVRSVDHRITEYLEVIKGLKGEIEGLRQQLSHKALEADPSRTEARAGLVDEQLLREIRTQIVESYFRERMRAHPGLMHAFCEDTHTYTPTLEHTHVCEHDDDVSSHSSGSTLSSGAGEVAMIHTHTGVCRVHSGVCVCGAVCGACSVASSVSSLHTGVESPSVSVGSLDLTQEVRHQVVESYFRERMEQHAPLSVDPPTDEEHMTPPQKQQQQQQKQPQQPPSQPHASQQQQQQQQQQQSLLQQQQRSPFPHAPATPSASTQPPVSAASESVVPSSPALDTYLTVLDTFLTELEKDGDGDGERMAETVARILAQGEWCDSGGGGGGGCGEAREVIMGEGFARGEEEVCGGYAQTRVCDGVRTAARAGVCVATMQEGVCEELCEAVGQGRHTSVCSEDTPVCDALHTPVSSMLRTHAHARASVDAPEVSSSADGDGGADVTPATPTTSITKDVVADAQRANEAAVPTGIRFDFMGLKQQLHNRAQVYTRTVGRFAHECVSCFDHLDPPSKIRLSLSVAMVVWMLTTVMLSAAGVYSYTHTHVRGSVRSSGSSSSIHCRGSSSRSQAISAAVGDTLDAAEAQVSQTGTGSLPSATIGAYATMYEVDPTYTELMMEGLHGMMDQAYVRLMEQAQKGDTESSPPPPTPSEPPMCPILTREDQARVARISPHSGTCYDGTGAESEDRCYPPDWKTRLRLNHAVKSVARAFTHLVDRVGETVSDWIELLPSGGFASTQGAADSDFARIGEGDMYAVMTHTVEEKGLYALTRKVGRWFGYVGKGAWGVVRGMNAEKFREWVSERLREVRREMEELRGQRGREGDLGRLSEEETRLVKLLRSGKGVVVGELEEDEGHGY